VPRRVLACIRKMLSFAVDQELVEHNPAVRMSRPGAEQSRERVLSVRDPNALD